MARVAKRGRWPVWLYIPNVLCYLRLALAAYATCARLPSTRALLFYCVAACTDAFDGVAARRLQQTSRFGAWLDVVCDNVQRGLAWHRAAASCSLPLLAAVPALEWTTMVCTHSQHGAEWKSRCVGDGAPWLCRAVMADGFRTPLGAWAVAGLHAAPAALWFFGRSVKDLGLGPRLLIATLLAGRVLAAAVEAWIVACSAAEMLRADRQRAQSDGRQRRRRKSEVSAASGAAAASSRASSRAS